VDNLSALRTPLHNKCRLLSCTTVACAALHVACTRMLPTSLAHTFYISRTMTRVQTLPKGGPQKGAQRYIRPCERHEQAKCSPSALQMLPAFLINDDLFQPACLHKHAQLACAGLWHCPAIRAQEIHCVEAPAAGTPAVATALTTGQPAGALPAGCSVPARAAHAVSRAPPPLRAALMTS
jgi:hypothetical protein